jgi:hypothetical protein
MNVNPISLIFIAFTTRVRALLGSRHLGPDYGLGVVLVISLFITERPWWRR